MSKRYNADADIVLVFTDFQISFGMHMEALKFPALFSEFCLSQNDLGMFRCFGCCRCWL